MYSLLINALLTKVGVRGFDLGFCNTIKLYDFKEHALGTWKHPRA